MPTSSRVAKAGGGVKERIKANGRVGGAGGETEEGIGFLSRVAVRIASVRCRDNRPRRRRQRKTSQDERDKKETAYTPQYLGTRQLLFTR